MTFKNLWTKIKEWTARIKLDLKTVYIALFKKETPLIAKGFALLAVGYALSPFDIIPDFIPILGYLDDLLILPVLIAVTIRLIPAKTLKTCRREALSLWPDGKPKKWYFGIPIILIWLGIIWIIGENLFLMLQP